MNGSGMRWIVAGLLLLLCIGCGPPPDPPPLTLATTTSTRDTGLLDALVPKFEEQTGIAVKVIAVGTGMALELGRRGDADVLLTHAPAAEQAFMDQGHGSERHSVMHNDFVLVGPADDPAEVRGTASIVEAFRRIAGAKAPFVSRGDESGTHMKERHIWSASGIEPAADWYVEGGSGMSAILGMADHKEAYTLSDRGTFLSQRSRLDLKILAEGDPLLVNPYAVIVVNRDHHPGINHEAAQKFAAFLLAPATQEAISRFGVAEYGQPLFFPDASHGAFR